MSSVLIITATWDIQQMINLLICEEFRKAEIEFAFPTYSVDLREATAMLAKPASNGLSGHT